MVRRILLGIALVGFLASSPSVAADGETAPLSSFKSSVGFGMVQKGWVWGIDLHSPAIVWRNEEYGFFGSIDFFLGGDAYIIPELIKVGAKWDAASNALLKVGVRMGSFFPNVGAHFYGDIAFIYGLIDKRLRTDGKLVDMSVAWGVDIPYSKNRKTWLGTVTENFFIQADFYPGFTTATAIVEEPKVLSGVGIRAGVRAYY